MQVSTEQMAQKSTIGKNKLWFAFQDADQLVKDEILLKLKKVGLNRHWYTTACKEKHNLLRAEPELRTIFLELLPETAPLFGLPAPKKATAKKSKAMSSAPLFEQ